MARLNACRVLDDETGFTSLTLSEIQEKGILVKGIDDQKWDLPVKREKTSAGVGSACSSGSFIIIHGGVLTEGHMKCIGEVRCYLIGTGRVDQVNKPLLLYTWMYALWLTRHCVKHGTKGGRETRSCMPYPGMWQDSSDMVGGGQDAETLRVCLKVQVAFLNVTFVLAELKVKCGAGTFTCENSPAVCDMTTNGVRQEASIHHSTYSHQPPQRNRHNLHATNGKYNLQLFVIPRQ